MSFIFESVPRVISRPGALSDVPSLLGELGCRRVLVVTDRGVLTAGILDGVLGRMRETFQEVVCYSDVQADPPEQVILDAIEAARLAGIDGVVGIGGGSSLDTAKLVALLLRSPQRLEAIYGIGIARGPRLPLILAPTTAGTGSESTPIAIVTTPSTEKKGVVSRLLLPDIAVLDPETTLSLPKPVTASTGIDAAVHAIEAFTSKHLKNPVSDALAIGSLTQIFRHLPTVLADGGDVVARGAMLEASCMAGMAFANAPVAAVHALAYPLGARFHIPHGVCNAIMLPHVLRFNMESHAALYADLARALFDEARGRSDGEAAAVLLRRTLDLLAQSGLPLRLSEWKIPASEARLMAVDAMKIDRLLRNNPREVTLEDAWRLYESAE